MALEDLLWQHNIIEGLENHALHNGESLQSFELENHMIISMLEVRNYSDCLWEDGKDGRKLKAS